MHVSSRRLPRRRALLAAAVVAAAGAAVSAPAVGNDVAIGNKPPRSTTQVRAAAAAAIAPAPVPVRSERKQAGISWDDKPTAPALTAADHVTVNGDVWDRLAECEAHGNWASTVGTFEGGLQFHPSTWDAYRPESYPSAAYEATREQQIAVAERVLADQGWAAWPACSRRLGLR